MSTLGNKIQQYRKQQRMTQAELAKKSGISVTSISRYELGTRSPTAEHISRILNALEISELEFYGSSMQILGDQYEKALADENDGLMDKYYGEFERVAALYNNNEDRIREQAIGQNDIILKERHRVMQVPFVEIDSTFSKWIQLKYTLVADEIYLIQAYLQLNSHGKKEAVRRVMELGMIEKYTQPDQKKGVQNGKH